MTKEEKEARQAEKLRIERERLQGMMTYENKYGSCRYICGVDEVGRGPFAGPVMAGAVILPGDCEILYLNDSKKLSKKKREALCEEIKEKAISWAVARVENDVIDEINILQATLKAMREAISQLDPKPDIILVDAVNIPDIDIPQEGIVKGDAKSVSIAAASILAKVTRDRVMEEYAKEYPGYGFEKNMGYGTAEHREALKEHGPTPIHRMSFIHNYV